MMSLLSYGSYQYLNNEGSGITTTITLEIQFSYGGVIPNENFVFDVNTSESILDATKSVANISVKYFFDLPYIEAINGIREDDSLPNHFWIFYIDDVKSLVHAGASLKKVNAKNGSILLWSYEMSN